MDEKGTKTVNDWKGKKLHSLYLVLGAFFVKIGTIIGKIVTLLDKIGTLWGKIETLMSKKRTNILCWSLGMMAEREPKPLEASFIISSSRNIIGQDRNKNTPKIAKNILLIS